MEREIINIPENKPKVIDKKLLRVANDIICAGGGFIAMSFYYLAPLGREVPMTNQALVGLAIGFGVLIAGNIAKDKALGRKRDEDGNVIV